MPTSKQEFFLDFQALGYNLLLSCPHQKRIFRFPGYNLKILVLIYEIFDDFQLTSLILLEGLVDLMMKILFPLLQFWPNTDILRTLSWCLPYMLMISIIKHVHVHSYNVCLPSISLDMSYVWWWYREHHGLYKYNMGCISWHQLGTYSDHDCCTHDQYGLPLDE